MKCYLINLDRAPERLARMTELLGRHEIEFERVAAIDARNFTAKELEIYRKQRAEGHELAPGDIACGSTHLKILRKIADGHDKYSVIMEDDLHLASDIDHYLTSRRWIPEGADIIKLETFREPTLVDGNGVRLPNGRRISRLRKKHLGAALYVISRDAAIDILAGFRPGVECIDVHMFEHGLDKYKIYQIHPAPAVQDNIGGFYSQPALASDINNQRIFASMPKPRGISKLNREIKRLYGKIFSVMNYIWNRVFKNKIYGKISYRL